ncbi:Ferric reductase domain protein transmembrane component domain [Hymenobacter roseosalivarius DSM 11622]|uniref:Ferric reductase domain protein transmembrane component domain n=1 Tax=Hymenobacter roseosalivarius DSM 11622 TaxID=645990 RepID=A0A1W1W2J7_9BACT|nr:ferric reductase-like transmembrane domain-containing protein [Hymenobacter roseosalivarius]SMB99700.1 Ferric reductase domain protein transmembrane component domain [Hymenobacter roseosalivarius DSM 11622]
MTATTASRPSRRFYHHGLLALLSGLLLSSLYLAVNSPDVNYKWGMSTAYASLLLLNMTLLTGPLNVLRKQRNPVSTDLRRDIGIWSGIVGLAHVAIGWQVHMGNMLLYFFEEDKLTKELSLRADLSGFANYMGLAGGIILILLLALSNDLSLRRLKAPRWKYWQRWNYLLYVLVIVHGVSYQVIESRQLPYPLLLAALILPVLVIQFRGFFHYRKNRLEGEKKVA